MVKMFYDADCNLSLLDGKTVAVLGFGSVSYTHLTLPTICSV